MYKIGLRRPLKLTIKNLSVLAPLVLAAVGYPTPSASQEKQIVGWLEQVKICPENLLFIAKLDTGAKNSSLNAFNIEKFERNGQKWIRFDVVDRSGKRKTLEKEILRIAKIKEDNSSLDRRPAIQLGICLGDRYREVEVNLTDRTGYNYRMLVGRSFMRGVFVVDPSIKFTTTPHCPEGCNR